ncbi:hypothetical protein FBUS_06927 [Fasciolopsis buskii]|uniref:G-protein coupled receptors family 1 profile domain-containing protein n=1 Tax=Fasciolopsis buskii TaxID=27845 RepID=A0A8E0RXY7_9TREM|nr:hypothetical protein FBUS_06927 [Fasciolopsis buski]
MNHTVGYQDSDKIATLKHVVMWLVTGFGLTSNVIGFVFTYYLEITFPATLLLLRLQFICDGFGCIVSAAYWITFIIKIPPGMLTDSAFAYFWSSYAVFASASTLSSTNLVLLSFDRFWAVIWFRSYPGQSKCYRCFLFLALWTYTIFMTIPTVVIAYRMTHLKSDKMATLVLLLKIHAIFVFMFAYIGLGILISILQIKVLLVLRRVKYRPARRPRPSDDDAQSKINVVEQNVRAISVGIVIMLIAYFVTRIYSQVDYVLRFFGLSQTVLVNGWQHEGIILYAINFGVNPLALIFTNALARNWIFGKAETIVRLLCHKIRNFI